MLYPEANKHYISRIKQSNGKPQYLMDHILGTSLLASVFAGKIGLPVFGELMGLLHDLGKYSDAFQSYIKSAEGILEPDDEDYINALQMKGKIDHSTAGAQFIWTNKGASQIQHICAQIMALCIASHHTGLIDCLSPLSNSQHVDNDNFSKRMTKPADKTHFAEVITRLEEGILLHIDQLRTSCLLEDELGRRLDLLIRADHSVQVRQFMLGFLSRFLFSTLIDADRLNAAEREPSTSPVWQIMIEKMESHLEKFTNCNNIDRIRAEISSSCYKFASRERGLYQLTVPTGGGKTLASLRFALHHADLHKMDRIIYVVPYTTIIDQNARIAREVFNDLEQHGRLIVLEHHSNLTPEVDTVQSKLLAENWDAPIIYTTAVQFLDTLFSAGTRGVRRLHQLANAVIIFDEIQTLPIRTIHLFNNAINFLVSQCESTVVFCTATQPLLHEVNPKLGAAELSVNSQMMLDVNVLFRDLLRARIEDHRTSKGWSAEEVKSLALEQLDASGSVLIIVNKKSQARELFKLLSGKIHHVYHLSTSMCPEHRMSVLDTMRNCLDVDAPQPIICISTALIEAGVDVDFGSVIRYLAGLDSIAQAAGRCNRNNLRATGRVIIINPANENLDSLPEIRMAKDVTERILQEFLIHPEKFDNELQSPAAIRRYYEYYFFKRACEMSFPIAANDRGRNDDILSLLSTNDKSVQVYLNAKKLPVPLHLRQSFMTASKAFKVIDAPTEGVIVPYGQKGECLIIDLIAASTLANKASLLKLAQRFSVNLFPYEIIKLKEMGRLYEVWAGSNVFYLDDRHYDDDLGISIAEISEKKTYIV